MSTQKKLSLTQAILININIMLGTGTFVNTVMLAKHVGTLGGFLYLCAGLLMLPLSFCFAQLTRAVPAGNFYAFGTVLGEFWGFISTWSYFIAKLASASFSMHVFAMFLQKTAPVLATIPLLILDTILVTIFILLNLLNIKTGSRIQYFFLSTKLIPLLFAIGVSLNYAQIINLQAPHMIWTGFPITLPLVLFCFLGFEATCSLSRVIENPTRNLSRTILISFSLVMTAIILYQTLFYASMGTELAGLTNFVDAFPLLLSKIAPNYTNQIAPLFSLTIGIAALGGAYGILYSNPWNLYTLAEQQHIPFSSYFIKLNSNNIPYFCVITEGVLCLVYLFSSGGAQIPLQYTATLGCLVTYAISILALFNLQRSMVSIIGLTSCLIASGACIRGFINTSIIPLILLGIILLLGVFMFFVRKKARKLS